MLFDATVKELVVIDHNLAFDRDFKSAEFLTHHVFAAQWAAFGSDLVLQVEYAKRLSDVLDALPVACHNAPSEWHWVNTEMDVPANFDLEDIQKTLNRCTTAELWRTI